MTIVIQVSAPPGSEQAVKESLAMYCERFGDCRSGAGRKFLPWSSSMMRWQCRRNVYETI